MVIDTDKAVAKRVVEILLTDARRLFESGQERVEAISASLRQHDVLLTRDVLLYLAFYGLGTLFDAETKAINIEAGKQAQRGVSRFGSTPRTSGNGGGGGAVLPPSTGFGAALDAGIESVLATYAATKTIFGRLLCDVDTDFLRDSVGRATSQVTGWTLTGDALQECVPIYEQHLTGGQTFADLPTEAQEKVVEILSEADATRKSLTEL